MERTEITRQHIFSKRGFTLAELLVVVAIIGILVSISIPVFNKRLEKSRETTDLANLRSAYAAARYLSATGEFTVTDASGNNPKTWKWESGYVSPGVDETGRIQHFFYDTESGKIVYTCPTKPCGKGTAVNAGTIPVFSARANTMELQRPQMPIL